MLVLFVFFKKKAGYEMRISGWSSDVCTSDLGAGFRHDEKLLAGREIDPGHAGDLFGRLGDDGGAEMAIRPDGVLQPRFFLRGDDIAALRLQLFKHGVIDRADQYHRIVRRAGGGQIKRLGNAYLLGSDVKIGGVVNGNNSEERRVG